MPTYLNEQPNPVVWGGVVWGPGESRALSYFVPDEMLGLTVASQDPTPSPLVLFSDEIALGASEEETIEVPYSHSQRFELTVFAISGAASLSLDDGGQSLTIDAKAFYRGRLEWRSCRRIVLSSAEGAVIRVSIEAVS